MGYLSENFNISISIDKLEKIKSIDDILKIIKKLMINLDFIVSCVPKNRISLNKSQYFKKRS